jgi:hypothetical protein
MNRLLGMKPTTIIPTVTPKPDCGRGCLRVRHTPTVARSLWPLAVLCFTTALVLGQYPTGPQYFKDGTAVTLQDYASLPISSRTISTYPPATNYSDQLSRVNFLRSEPSNAPLSAARFFVSDLNRNLYILDKTTKSLAAYINFEVIFPKFINGTGYSGGLVTFAFDPDYANNHKFYTVHTENPSKSGSAMPTNGALPALDLTGYTLTAPFNPPGGTSVREAVVVEWADANITNTIFEGTAREVLRIGFNDDVHPIGDLLFNPLAKSGDADYRNLYLAVGDGAAGENAGPTHTTPQRLDALQGKILRITPDITLRPADQLSSNGCYRIPITGTDTNPFVSLSLTGLKKEIFAYGFRNAHRLSWDPDSNKLLENDIGLSSWEEINIITKGANYGYAEREGIEQLMVGGPNNGKTGSQTSPVTPFPSPDTLIVTGLVSAVTPIYPVATYSHRDGDAIASGFVYRGTLMPGLRGKYLFGDITTARLFYCDLGEMIATEDGVRTNVAPIHELQVVFNGAERRLFDIVAAAFAAKGGTNPGSALPTCGGGLKTTGNDPYGVPYGCGRADIRLAQGGDGEAYILSKSDGMIRKMVALLSPPSVQSIRLTNNLLSLTWSAVSNHTYRVQSSPTLASSSWTNLTGDITATNSTASKTDLVVPSNRFYRVLQLQ